MDNIFKLFQEVKNTMLGKAFIYIVLFVITSVITVVGWRIVFPKSDKSPQLEANQPAGIPQVVKNTDTSNGQRVNTISDKKRQLQKSAVEGTAKPEKDKPASPTITGKNINTGTINGDAIIGDNGVINQVPEHRKVTLADIALLRTIPKSYFIWIMVPMGSDESTMYAKEILKKLTEIGYSASGFGQLVSNNHEYSTRFDIEINKQNFVAQIIVNPK